MEIINQGKVASETTTFGWYLDINPDTLGSKSDLGTNPFNNKIATYASCTPR